MTGQVAFTIIFLKAADPEGGNKNGGSREYDRQYDGILQMIEMIVNGCKDLDEAKKKIAELRKDKNEKGKTE